MAGSIDGPELALSSVRFLHILCSILNRHTTHFCFPHLKSILLQVIGDSRKKERKKERKQQSEEKEKTNKRKREKKKTRKQGKKNHSEGIDALLCQLVSLAHKVLFRGVWIVRPGCAVVCATNERKNERASDREREWR